MNFNIFISDPQTTVTSMQMNGRGHIPGKKSTRGSLYSHDSQSKESGDQISKK